MENLANHTIDSVNTTLLNRCYGIGYIRTKLNNIIRNQYTLLEALEILYEFKQIVTLSLIGKQILNTLYNDLTEYSNLMRMNKITNIETSRLEATFDMFATFAKNDLDIRRILKNMIKLLEC